MGTRREGKEDRGEASAGCGGQRLLAEMTSELGSGRWEGASQMENTGVRRVVGSGYREPQNRQHEETGYLGNSRASVMGGTQVQMGEW